MSVSSEIPLKNVDLCRGSGSVECMCTRWSDDDCGCGICQGSGRMSCHSCGGGGGKVPIVLRIPASSRYGSCCERLVTTH